MPLATIVGIESRDYVAKGTGEIKNMTVIHYTYKLNGKGMTGVGAESVFVDIERYDPPKDLGAVYMVDKDKRGFLSNLELVKPADSPGTAAPGAKEPADNKYVDNKLLSGARA